jgi:hypothetical protein
MLLPTPIEHFKFFMTREILEHILHQSILKFHIRKLLEEVLDEDSEV